MKTNKILHELKEWRRMWDKYLPCEPLDDSNPYSVAFSKGAGAIKEMSISRLDNLIAKIEQDESHGT